MAQFDSIRFQPSRPLLKEISADRLNAILAEIKKNRVRGERGITVRQTGDTTFVGLAASIKGGTTPATPQPWDLQASQDPDNENQYLVRVRPGTLNGILPSNWDIEQTLQSTGLHYAKAVINTDGVKITGVTIAIDTTAPVAQSPQLFGIENSVEYLFGLFAEGQVHRVIGSGNITLVPEVWLVKDKGSAAEPGQFPYDIFYYLK